MVCKLQAPAEWVKTDYKMQATDVGGLINSLSVLHWDAPCQNG